MKTVLFVCNHNAGRSQMAQAFFERRAPDDVRAESAGTDPARQIWPEVVEVMREVDIDISTRKPTRLLLEMQLHADWAVTMGCGDACPLYPGKRYLDGELEDPDGKSLQTVRRIRDEIDERVRSLVSELPLTVGDTYGVARSGRTGYGSCLTEQNRL